MSSGLIGRESEVADLRGLLAGAGPRFVLVEGEAGIGKTALVRAVAVADAAPRVRWSHGAEDGGPALSLWRQLTPEVDPEGSGDRFALRAALRDVLGDCLLVIDDVQWADEASLSLLRGLLRDPGCRGLVCCATRRSGEAGAGWARIGPELTGGPAADRLGLGGLSDPAAAALVRAHGRALDEGEVERAVRAGGGNPLFLRELARAPGDRGSVGELIAARVRRLGPPAQRLLRAASLLAEDAELTVVSRLLDESVLGCLPAVDAALSAGLLTDSGGGRFRFAHGLVRTVLAAQTPLQEAVVLHLRAAEALEDLHRDGLAEVSAAIARHRVAVAVTGDRAPAVAWARRAAADATRALAHEEAARWYATALDCGGASLGRADRAELQLARGVAEAAAGRFSPALEACRAAVELADECGRTDVVAAAALALEAVGAGDRDRTVERWCVRALASLGSLGDGDADRSLRARLLARLAETRFYGGDTAGSGPPAVEALAVAEACADPDAIVAALRANQLTHSGPEHAELRAELAARMTGLGERLGRPAVEMWGRLWTVDGCWERGDLAGVEAELARVRWCVAPQHSPLADWHLLVARAALAQARGELRTALELGRDALRLVAGTGHPAAAGAWLSLVGVVGHHLGPLPAEVAALDPGPVDVAEARSSLFTRLGPALVLADAGRLDEAAHHYRLAGPPREWEVPPYFTVLGYAVGAMVAVSLDLRADVAWFRETLTPYSGGHVVAGGGPASYQGPVDLVLGRCAAALDDLGPAADLLATALATADRIGAPGVAVEAACELAAVRLRTRDPDGARALLSRVRPAAQRMGMTPWLARIDGLLGGTAGPLTAREREVAELVALGRSNREIAGELVLSERTVGNHVQHILTKLGFANRSQIAAWVAARG